MTDGSAPQARTAREAAIWQQLRSLVLDRGDYRRAVSDALGMSFFRVKALRRVAAAPLTMRELAAALTTDASYTTIVVGDLERRGLVSRSAQAGDRRAKVVTATAAGRRAARRANKILATPPASMARLAESDLAALERVVASMTDQDADDDDDGPSSARGG